MTIEKATKKVNAMNKKSITCWGKKFLSITALVEDKRCVVSVASLYSRLKRGVKIEDAVTLIKLSRQKSNKPRNPSPGIPIVCWGIKFLSLAALSRDSRCVVSQGLLRCRWHDGWDIKRAAITPVDEIAARRRS